MLNVLEIARKRCIVNLTLKEVSRVDGQRVILLICIVVFVFSL